MNAKNGRGRQVLLGLSGGVDSAVAAWILQERGYQVTAVRMRIYDGPDDGSLSAGCYGRDAADDTASAADLAKRLGIPFQVLDCAKSYQELVLADFKSEYLAGRTPNPCIRCNQLIKFGALWRAAETAGLKFDFFATGHYARLTRRPADPPPWAEARPGAETPAAPEVPVLQRGRDASKDQSYFLYRLSREQLARTLFPLGDLTKEEVRRLAGARGWPVHDRPDSQDFYAGDYADLLKIPDREGEVVDSGGRVLGRHRGFWHFTPGQRKGLGVCGPAPLYVLKVEAGRNRVVVGPAEENSFLGCRLTDLAFPWPPPAPGIRLLAKIRSAQPLQEVVVAESGPQGPRRLDFTRPLSGLAPGQSLVFYHGDLVLGGGIIQPLA